MKKIFVFAAIAAMVAFTACTKEISSEITELEEIAQEEVQPGYVRMSFSAAMESDLTKAYLSGKTVLWAGDESIAVFDHDAGGAANKFDIEGSGASASFTGTVPVGVTSFTAVYPYSDAITYVAGDGSPIRTVIPAVQEATLGSFDPAAATFVATATSFDAALTFTPAFSLFKVNVDVDNVVQVSVSTTTNNLAGSVKVSRSGGLGNGDGDLSKTIVLKKADDSVLAQGVYYIVTRFPATDKSFANFTLKYVTSDAKTNSRVSVDGIADTQFARKDILNLGSLSAMPGSAYTSWYEYYQLGYDIKIGSKTINKATNGDATLIQNGSASDVFDFRSAVNGKTGVFFFNTAGGAFKNASTISISQNLYLLNDTNTEVLFTNPDNKSWNFMNGSLYIKGLTFDVSGRTGGALFTNTTGVSAVSDDLIMEDCAFYGMTKNLYAPNSSFKQYIVRRIEAIGCSFGYNMTGNIDMINLSAATQPADFQHFVFNNNLVYNSTGTNTTRVTILSMPAYAEATYTLDAQITKNLMVNAVGASNGSWAFTDVVSLEIKDNVFYDGNNFGSNCNLFDIKNTSTSVSSLTLADNTAIGLVDGKKWTYTNGTISALDNVKSALPGGTNQITKSDAATVFSVAPIFAGGVVSYTLQPAYADRGPQE